MPEHPRVPLLLALEGEPDDAVAQQVRAAVAALLASRPWTTRPAFVDEHVDDVRTVGLVMELLSSHPPWGESIALEVDRLQFEEAKAAVDAMGGVARALNDDVVVELNGEAIGWIERGTPDRGVEEAFLGEWARELTRRAGGR